MANTMETVYNILDIDKLKIENKMILIEEQHNTNANFLVNAILSNALKGGNAVCLVLCHNTFGHYHNVGMRLGYNLLSLKEKGQVTVVEPMKIIASNIASMRKDSIDEEKPIIADTTREEHLDIAQRLIKCIRKKYLKARLFDTNVSVIIDDINHLLNFGLSTYDVMYFIRYLRSFMETHTVPQLCILAHTYQEDPQISNADMIANELKHVAHLCIKTEPLETGYSGDASGTLTINWQTKHLALYWSERKTYLFKLLNWQVKVYTPGETSILS